MIDTGYTFGNKSMKQYLTLHSDLQMILDWGIKRCIVDFSLHEGHRPPEKQFEYFRKGRKLNPETGEWTVVNKKAVITNVDGFKVKGKHNYSPALAVDITAYVPDKPELAWDSHHLTFIAGILTATADQLYDLAVINHRLRWGGNWDLDGDLSDNRLYDRPHFELYKP